MMSSFVKCSGVKMTSQSDLRGKQQKKCQTKQKGLRIGTWNVKTLLSPGKLENLKKEMEINNMDIVGVSELRWEGKDELRSGKVTMYYSGIKRGTNGVGIVVKNDIAKRVQKVIYVDDRLIAIRIEMLPKDLVILQVYMPTTRYEDEDIEMMYSKIDSIMEEEGDCCKLILGDWNAVVGEGEEGKEVGKYGLGTRNRRGERLIEFCKEKKLIITNTCFKNHKRRRYTWTRPTDGTRYQIDYILIDSRYRNAVKKAHGLPGADIGSDHVLVMTEISLKLKKIKSAKKVKKWNLEKMRDIGEEKFGDMLTKAIIEEKEEKEDGEEAWRRIKKAIRKTAEKEIGFYEGARIKKPWVTREMMCKMEERRRYKNKDGETSKAMYRKLNNELRRETDKAKQRWLKEECEDIEDLERKRQYDIMYERVKNVSWDKKKTNCRMKGIEGKDGLLLYKEEEVRKRWEEYIEDLYMTKDKPESLNIEGEEQIEEEDKGPSILESEIRQAIKEMKSRKATGVDDLPIEFFKCIRGEGIKELTGMCNKIYNSGEWPEDFVKTIMIPIPKKSNTRRCGEHRTISLISHAAKILLRIMNRRLTKIMEENVSEEQFGFRKGKGTREAIGVIRMIGERCIERGKGLSLCFIDMEKAFDRVLWDKLFQILKDKGMDWKDRRLIKDLYMRQKAAVNINGNLTNWVELGRGVRQGCCLSPTLFNLYIEDMICTIIEGKEGISIGGQNISCIRFADDMVIVSKDTPTLQRLIGLLEKGMEGYGMKINVKKTKIMRVNEPEDMTVITKHGKIEQVKKYRYLGTLLTEDWRSETEVRMRIAMAKEAFTRKKTLFCSSLNLELRKRLVKCYVWSIFLYGCETWTLGKKEKGMIEAFEMWVWRKMEKISWVDKVKNDEVLRRVKEDRVLLKKIINRKANWLGHIMRGKGIMNTVLEGTVEGERRRGRKRLKAIDEVKEGESYKKTKEQAWDRSRWRQKWC